MDFVAIWKASSIVLTGGFGILGLVKDFKDKSTNKVTKWGYVSLAGILVSTTFGVAAQLKESSDDAARALALAKKTDATLGEIERILQPIQDPTITLKFRVRCSLPYQEFCNRVDASFSKDPTHAVACDGKGWPTDVKLRYYVNFLIDSDREIETVFGQPIDFDLSYAIHGEGMKCWAVTVFREYAIVTLSNEKPRVMRNRGTIKSILDFHRVTLFVSSALSDNTEDLTLEDCSLRAKDGQEVALDEPNEAFQRTTNERWINFSYDFPPQ